jgi:hypothetical protein
MSTLHQLASSVDSQEALLARLNIPATPAEGVAVSKSLLGTVRILLATPNREDRGANMSQVRDFTFTCRYLQAAYTNILTRPLLTSLVVI